MCLNLLSRLGPGLANICSIDYSIYVKPVQETFETHLMSEAYEARDVCWHDY